MSSDHKMEWPKPTYLTPEEMKQFYKRWDLDLSSVPKEVADAAMEQARRYLAAHFGKPNAKD